MKGTFAFLAILLIGLALDAIDLWGWSAFFGG